ncbi:MAG: discoidin domain-containing protein [Dongiaceae bacterium]
MRVFKTAACVAVSGAPLAKRRIMRKLSTRIVNLFWRIRVMVSEFRSRMEEPRLFNAACKRPATQSSTRGRGRISGAKRGTNGLTGGNSYFSTRKEDRPWWMVELGADWPIHSIRIHNRRGWKSAKTAFLQVSISPDGLEWDVVHYGLHQFGTLASHQPLVIRLLETRGGRFVKLELPHGGQLTFNQVEVMVAKRHKALRRVARRYGFIFECMTSLRMRRHAKPYSVCNVPSSFDGRVEAFHVSSKEGRFGNNVKQIGCAVSLAQKLGIPRVYLTSFPMLHIDRPISVGDVTILPERHLTSDRPKGVLRGTFYSTHPFGSALGERGYYDIARAARAVGQPLFQRTLAPPALVPGAADLAIHLRSGDIFAKEIPHNAYVQPPLSYYRLCVNFARAHLGTERVILVYEDEGNPCIGALKAWLDEINFPYVVHSRSFAEDVAVLASAPHCVFGRGTFGPGIAILSNKLHTVFYSWLQPTLAEISKIVEFRTVKVEDAAGAYIKVLEWRNTPEQRQMMLDYPIENLRLVADWTTGG